MPYGVDQQPARSQIVAAVWRVPWRLRLPTKTFAKAMDRAFGTPGPFERLGRRLSDVPFPAAFRSFAPHEQEATALRRGQRLWITCE